MVRSAPRYDPRIVDALSALDDRSLPMAEVCRRVGTVAERLGLARPSLVHLRRLLRQHRLRQDAERARREALRGIAANVARDLTLGLRVDAYEVAARVADVSD